ncbi:hypothetical protein HHK36_017122 [Tetracentron sinense]|uniref:BZIP domain-containing protein n=1 Tax=Tetracentron sinense TaxID=13715 RepID=A0A834Z6L1_TETSI|nr:hypothetical protein HHK36_017122 [Tetracentron sinense]
MANPGCLEPSPEISISEIDHSNPNLSTEFDCLSLPPLDSDFFSEDPILGDDFLADLGFEEDFDFSFDDISLPPENEDFLLGDSSESVYPVGVPSEFKEELGVSSSSQISIDQGSDVARFLNFPSPESGSCNQELSGPASHQDSGGCGSGVGEVSISPSSDSGSCNREISGSVPSSPNSSNIQADGLADQKTRLDEVEKTCFTKRKKEKESGDIDSRSNKFRKSSPPDSANSPYAFNSGNEEDEKRRARLMRNRESAHLSRQRKKHHVEELEDKLRSMHSKIAELNNTISFIMAENASLHQQLGGGSFCRPPPGIYPPPPMAPMPYPWVPCASYSMRTQGSQVPLVPIPRLKPQQSVSATKAKKSENKKTEGKTKKVASVSLLGVLFFMLLFGGLVPFVNVRYGGSRDIVTSGLNFSSSGFNGGRTQGMVLTVNGHLNGSDQSVGEGSCVRNSGFGEGDTKRMLCKRGRTGGVESEVEQTERRSQPLPGSDGFVRLGNSTEPLVASLYVPRNDKLVKIDGNLIIHSVLASEKAMASSHVATAMKSDKPTVSLTNDAIETGLAVAGNLGPALPVSKVGRNKEGHPHLYRSPVERQKALTSGSRDTYKDNLKSTAADGTLQEWFREGLAGPMLSSGMCTEVFHFDVSPASAKPGAIIPATSVTNISAERHSDTTAHLKGKNRRILYRSPIPLAASSLNNTEERVGGPSQNDSFQGNRSVSSMVVSVLVDPREVDEGESDRVSAPKSLPRIFVVVLLDGVKYVTYSCMLPFKGSSPSLVTT